MTISLYVSLNRSIALTAHRLRLYHNRLGCILCWCLALLRRLLCQFGTTVASENFLEMLHQSGILNNVAFTFVTSPIYHVSGLLVCSIYHPVFQFS